MQDRGVPVTPLWGASEANAPVWWIELVGDVFHNPDCASCPDAPKAYMGLRPSDGALLWLATEIPPDVATHTPTPTTTPTATPTAAALDPALAGTSWTLVTLDGAQVLRDAALTIAFVQTELVIYDGCNDIYAPYLAASNGSLILGSWMSTAVSCLDQAHTDQASRFTALLFAVAHYQVVGTQLRLETADGRTLLFTAAEYVAPGAQPTETVTPPTP